MDFALAQLALIFMPGLIWANIDAKYGVGLKPSQTLTLIRSFLFGMATYVVLYIIYLILGYDFGYEALGTNSEKIDFIELRDEISWSLPLSLALSIGWLFFVKNRIFMKFLHYIGASLRYGDEDVWSFTLNSSQANVEYVHFRDLKNGHVFAGWVNTYSESEEFRELLLRDAIVYDEEGNELSNPPLLYLSRPKDSIWIEFPYNEKGYDDVKKDT